MNCREKIENLMDYLQDSGLWTNTFSDIILGSFKSIHVDAHNSINISFPEKGAKHYNSILLFTALSALQKPRGSLIYTGGPGIGKTTVGEYMAHFMYGIPLEEIQNAELHCHPELTEEKMIATLDTAKLINPAGSERVPIWRPLISCPVHIFDEVSRLPPDKADIMYNLIDRGIAHYMEFQKKIEDGPILATMNYADAGTFIMTPPFMDRWELSVKAPSPNALDFEVITNRPEGLEILLTNEEMHLKGDKREKLLKQRKAELYFSKAERDKAWNEMKDLDFDKEARAYVHYLISQINFCRRAASSNYNPCAPAFMTKGNCEVQKPDQLCGECHFTNAAVCSYTENELSVRALKSVYKYSRAMAWFLDQKEVTIETVKQTFPFVARHRLKFTNSLFGDAENANDPGLKNDSAACVTSIMKKAEDGFQKAGDIFDNYGAINEAFEEFEKGNLKTDNLVKVVTHAQQDMSQHDDPLKFALACWLQKIYHYVVTNYT